METGLELISADSHVALSHDDVKARLASRVHASYDAAVAAYGLQAASRVADSMPNLGPYWHRLGHFEAKAHLDDMDLDGISAEVVYCEVSAFRYLYLLSEGAIDATRAFNDTLHDYASVDPTRLVVSYQIPIHDIALAVGEVQRVAGLGGKSLQLPVFPTELGLPDYFDERYDPLWSAVSETGLPICCHTGFNAALQDLQRRDPTPDGAMSVPMLGLTSAEAFGAWILGGVFARFPDLKVVFVEPGLGWVSWYVHYLDEMILKHGYRNPRLVELPSVYFHRNVFLTFMEDAESLQLLRHRIGIENILWATDYPHPPTTWPNSRAVLDEQFLGIPFDERAAITAGNARRVWNLA